MDLFEILLAKKLGGNGGGGITPSGTKDITANGNDIDVYSYAKVNVNVPNPSTGKVNITTTSEVNVTNYATAQVVDSDLIASNIKKDVNILGVTGTYEGGGGGGTDTLASFISDTECVVPSGFKMPSSIRSYAFFRTNADLNNADFSDVTELKAYRFKYDNASVSTVNKGIKCNKMVFDKPISLQTEAFAYTYNIKETIFKEAVTISTSNTTPFHYSFIQSIRMPKQTTFPTTQYAFGVSSGSSPNKYANLRLIDLGLITSFNIQNAFQNQDKLNVVILRNTSNVVTINSTTFLTQNCSFNSGGSGGTIYVPSALKSSYEANTNWANVLSANNLVSFASLEGSPYENPNFTYTPV